MLIKLAEQAFGASSTTTKKLPLYLELIKFSDNEIVNLLQLRVVCFASSTWINYASALKPYINFCKIRKIPLYPVDTSILDLCVLKLVQDRKTTAVIDNLFKAVIFASNFLGCKLSFQDRHIKNTIKFVSKICNTSNRQKDGFDSKDIRKIWNEIEDNGGLKNLSMAELRTFVMAVFSHHTLCRFSCANVLKLNDLFFHKDYFELFVKFSKTDQEGKGQFTILPYKQGPYNPHRLMCLYIQALNIDESNFETMYLFPPLV